MQDFEQINIQNSENGENENSSLENEALKIEETAENFYETEEKETENAEQIKYIPVPVFVPMPELTVEQKEKKQIKKVALLAGLACLIMMGITVFWSSAYFALMSFFGISVTEAQKIASDPFILQVLQIILSSFMFIVPFTLVYKIGGLKISETIALDCPKKSDILPLTLIGVGFCSFANIAVAILGNFFMGFGIDYEVNRPEDPKGILGFIISFIATAIIPALVEEFACRGLILGSLKKYGEAFAIIASSVVFGLIHGNFEQIPFAFLVGIILGFITVKSGSIWLACLIHFINNGASVTIDYVLKGFSQNSVNIFYNVYLMAALLVGILGAVIFVKKRPDAFYLENLKTKTEETTKYRWFFTQPLMIILILVCFIEAIAYFFN